MNRRFGWAMLVAGVVFFGGMMSAHQRTEAGPPDSPAAQGSEEPQDPQAKQGEAPQAKEAPRVQEDTTEIGAQLKEINSQLKDLTELLRSGDVRVIVNMNPPEQ